MPGLPSAVIVIATVQSQVSTRQAKKTAQDLNELASCLAETVEQYQL